jgi:hypothetical protein
MEKSGENYTGPPCISWGAGVMAIVSPYFAEIKRLKEALRVARENGELLYKESQKILSEKRVAVANEEFSAESEAGAIMREQRLKEEITRMNDAIKKHCTDICLEMCENDYWVENSCSLEKYRKENK